MEFPTDEQVRYLERVPQRGEVIRGLADEAFVVLRVEPDGGGFVVTCVPPPTGIRRAKTQHAETFRPAADPGNAGSRSEGP